MGNIKLDDIYDITDIDMFYKKLDNIALFVVKLLINKGLKVSTAESLTGGMISQYLTAVPGASDVIELGICSYSDRIKNKILGVDKNILKKYTAVSEPVALQMVDGILKLSGSDVAVAVTGIAGPGGGSVEQPVGTVYVAVGFKDKRNSQNLKLYEKYPDANRQQMRMLTCLFAMIMLADIITGDRK